MALLTAALITRSGVDLAGAAAGASGDTFANLGNEYVVITNGGGSPITVTLDMQATVDGAAVTDPTVSVGAGVTKMIGPFPTGWYNDGNGLAKVSTSSQTSVTIKVVKLA